VTYPAWAIWHITAEELYLFEPSAAELRRSAHPFSPAKDKRKDAPSGFTDPIDHRFLTRYLSQFVRLDLSRPDQVLVDDLMLFVRSERRGTRTDRR